MKIFLLFTTLLFSIFLQAQDETIQNLKKEATVGVKKDAPDTSDVFWSKGGIYNINLSQGSLTNWAAGGDNFSLSVNSLLNMFAFYKKDKYSWDNTLDFNFGYVKTTSLGSRKNDDRLDLLSKYGYAVSSKWNVASLFNFRSQLLKGFTYPDGVETFSSAFLSPAYILFSLGMDYKPSPSFSIFLSPSTVRWIIVKHDSIAAKGLYGVPVGKHSVTEIGAFVTANLLTDLNKNISYKGRLDLFSNYKHNPENVDLFMTNVFSVKLSRLLSASWNVDFIYDDDVRIFGKNGKSPALQVKSIIGLGLLLKF
ncbi:MAG TPA: DUF3078 domain-containing protein [Flavisolibacter sp.]|nr:DUF3078 domain-containing protein [Flavisolibacter sp.]